MRCKLFLGLLAASLLLLLPTFLVAETVTANFEQGKGTYAAPVTDVVDAFTGNAGDGWTAGWITPGSTANVYPTHEVLGELDGGYDEVAEDNYLHFNAMITATSSGRFAAVSRNYSDGIDTTKDHTLSFSYRIDEDLSSSGKFTTSNDRYEIHDLALSSEDTTTSFGSTKLNTWGLAIYGNLDTRSGHWLIRNSAGTCDTGIVAATGVTYDITLDFHMAAGTYDVSIAGDDNSSFSGSNFVFYDAGGTLGNAVTGYLNFTSQGQRDDGEDYNYREFSIDGISVVQVPEPSMFIMVFSMLVVGLVGGRSRKR